MSNYLPAGFIIGVVFLFEIVHDMGGGRMVPGMAIYRCRAMRQRSSYQPTPN